MHLICKMHQLLKDQYKLNVKTTPVQPTFIGYPCGLRVRVQETGSGDTFGGSGRKAGKASVKTGSRECRAPTWALGPRAMQVGSPGASWGGAAEPF